MSEVRERVPVHLIGGPLGVGKTTALNHLLGQRPHGETWAVLINEYGLIGLDAALLETPGQGDDVAVREVAGGCICCSAGLRFEMALVTLLDQKPDRLFIEPTGLASLSGIVDTLRLEGFRERIDLRPIVCLLDPSTLEADLQRGEVRDQVDGAQILLASRSDLAEPSELQQFERWAAQLFPPKLGIRRIEQGLIELAWLDQPGVPRQVEQEHAYGHAHHHEHGHGHQHEHGEQHEHGDQHDHAHGHQHEHGEHHEHGERHDHGHRHEHAHHHAEARDEAPVVAASEAHPVVRQEHHSEIAHVLGWVCWDQLVFDGERIARWLTRCAQSPGVQRAKAVVQTNEGWWSFNYARGVEDLRPSSYRGDSRLELILDPGAEATAERWEEALRSCLVGATS